MDERSSQINRSDRDTFEQTWGAYYKALCYFAQNFVARKDVAEDIAGESLTKLWKRWDQVTTVEHAKAFLFITTRNACLTFLNREQKRREKQQTILALQAAEATDIEPLVIEVELLLKVYTAIECLPDQCRKVMKLSYLEGMHNNAIAEILHISPHTVKNHKIRGIQLLKIQFEGQAALMLVLVQLLAKPWWSAEITKTLL